MSERILKSISLTCYIVGGICAVLLLSRNTYGIETLLRYLFYILGAFGILLNLTRYIQKKEDNSFLYWLGNLGVYLGLIFKTLHQPYANYLIYISLAIAILSTFYNPFRSDTNKPNDELLD